MAVNWITVSQYACQEGHSCMCLLSINFVSIVEAIESAPAVGSNLGILQDL